MQTENWNRSRIIGFLIVKKSEKRANVFMDQLWIVPIDFSDARQMHFLDMSMPVDFQFLLQSGLHKFLLLLLQSYKLFSFCFL